MNSEISLITEDLSSLVETLNNDSKTHKNIRLCYLGILSEDVYHWQIIGEQISFATASYAAISFHSAEHAFRGYCKGKYDLPNLSELKYRITSKFL